MTTRDLVLAVFVATAAVAVGGLIEAKWVENDTVGDLIAIVVGVLGGFVVGAIVYGQSGIGLWGRRG